MRLHPSARAELRQEIAWYERQLSGLGGDFAAAVDRALDEIARAPERWPGWLHDPEVRRYRLRRFPFTISYLIERGAPFVVAIAHMRRDPKNWKRRRAPAKR